MAERVRERVQVREVEVGYDALRPQPMDGLRPPSRYVFLLPSVVYSLLLHSIHRFALYLLFSPILTHPFPPFSAQTFQKKFGSEAQVARRPKLGAHGRAVSAPDGLGAAAVLGAVPAAPAVQMPVQVQAPERPGLMRRVSLESGCAMYDWRTGLLIWEP